MTTFICRTKSLQFFIHHFHRKKNSQWNKSSLKIHFLWNLYQAVTMYFKQVISRIQKCLNIIRDTFCHFFEPIGKKDILDIIFTRALSFRPFRKPQKPTFSRLYSLEKWISCKMFEFRIFTKALSFRWFRTPWFRKPKTNIIF